MANVPLVSWDEADPADSDLISEGAGEIRKLKSQLREVIEVDHDIDSSGQGTDWGQHKKVTLQDQTDLGTGATGKCFLGAQGAEGSAELVFTDEDDNDVQITEGGKLGSATTNILGNDANLSGDITVSGAVNLGGNLQFDDESVLISSVKDEDDMSSDSATALATQQSIKKYVDDKVKELGAYETTDASQVGGTGATLVGDGTVYTASYSGQVSSYRTDSTKISGFCDTGTATTEITRSQGTSAGITFDVAAGEKWKVLDGLNVKFKPRK